MTGSGRPTRSVGILGIGPQATVWLQEAVHRESQKRLPPGGPTGYPTMIVLHHRRPPVELDGDGRPVRPLRADRAFLEAAAWLGEKADFVVIAANSPHLFARDVEAAAGRPLLSMIHVALREVRRRGWRRVGVLGFLDADVPVYTMADGADAFRFEILDEKRQVDLNAAILRVMEGREDDASRAAARSAVRELRSRGVDGIVLGCTEIPLLLSGEEGAADLLDPAASLAVAIVEEAMR